MPRPVVCLALLLALALFIPFAVPSGLHAQVVERERQEVVWPGAGVLEIAPELRNRLGLFPEVEGFRVARLFLREQGGAVLEIESFREGRLHRERRLLGDDDIQSFRAELEDRQAALGGRAVFTREGRGALVLGHTVLGLGYHGWAVPLALDIDSGQGAVAAYLLTAGASFYLPYRLTRERSVSEAHRALSLYGGSRGIASGLFLGDLLVGDEAPGVYDPDRDDRRRRLRFTGGILTGAAGGLLGFHAVDRWAPDEGTASLWGAVGDFGLVSGAALGLVAGPYAEETVRVQDGDLIYDETRLRNRQAGHALTLAGQAAGLGLGVWLLRDRRYSTGDVAAFRSAGVLGAQVGATVTRAAGVDESRGIAAGALAAGLGGVVLGDRLLREVELSRGEGLLVNAGHLAGGAAALGITYLIVEEIDEHPVLFLSTSTLGSLLGAGLVWRAVRTDGVIRARGGMGTSGGGSPDGAGRPMGRVEGTGVLPGPRSMVRWEMEPTGLLPGNRHTPFLTLRW